MRICRNSMCLWIVAQHGVAHVQEAFSCISVVWQLITQAVLLPPPFPPSFHCFNSEMRACSSYCVGAYGWVPRICQPWEQSSFRSWLPIVEAPRCFKHPISILAMWLLTKTYSRLTNTSCVVSGLLTNCWPSVSQLLTNRQHVLWPKPISLLLDNSQQTINWQTADRRSTDDQQSTNKLIESSSRGFSDPIYNNMNKLNTKLFKSLQTTINPQPLDRDVLLSTKYITDQINWLLLNTLTIKTQYQPIRDTDLSHAIPVCNFSPEISDLMAWKTE